MNKKPLIVGIAGPSGSGKSSLARTLAQTFNSQDLLIIAEDAYYKDHSHLAFKAREKLNFDCPEAFDHDLLCSQLIQLSAGQPIKAPLYNHALHTREKHTQLNHPAPLILIEGILVLSEPRLRELMDIRIFMDTPLDICFARRLRRDIRKRHRSIESVIDQYLKTVRPMYFEYIKPSAFYADIIITQGGSNLVAIDMIKTKLTNFLMS